MTDTTNEELEKVKQGAQLTLEGFEASRAGDHLTAFRKASAIVELTTANPDLPSADKIRATAEGLVTYEAIRVFTDAEQDSDVPDDVQEYIDNNHQAIADAILNSLSDEGVVNTDVNS